MVADQVLVGDDQPLAERGQERQVVVVLDLVRAVDDVGAVELARARPRGRVTSSTPGSVRSARAASALRSLGHDAR